MPIRQKTLASVGNIVMALVAAMVLFGLLFSIFPLFVLDRTILNRLGDLPPVRVSQRGGAMPGGGPEPIYRLISA